MMCSTDACVSWTRIWPGATLALLPWALAGCAFLDDFSGFHAGDGGMNLTLSDGGTQQNPDKDAGNSAGGAGMQTDKDAGGTTGGGVPFSCNTAFKSCGGDVAGAWKIMSSCVALPPQTIPNCPTASVTGSKASVTGTFTFGNDLSYTLDFSTTETITTFVPKSCLNVGATCADIDQTHPELVMDTGTACIERQTLSQPTVEVGSYEVVDDQVLMTPNGGGGATDDPFDFCVKDGAFTGRQAASDGSGTIVTLFAKPQ